MKENMSLVDKYKLFKAKHPDVVLLVRSGDWYVTYNTDAKFCSDTLGITLTWRDSNYCRHDFESYEGAVAGFPRNEFDKFIRKLLKAGRRIGVCDELEDAKKVNNLIKASTLQS